ncbi:MAG: uL15 family ribosomal protein [Candidatus Asgardarchaeia archaeon]
MTVSRRKKVRKYRGSRTHGYGRVGQHRKGGQRGGKGNTGGHKHLWIKVIKYFPDYFGKHGFHRPNSEYEVPSFINVGKLDQIVPDLLKEGIAKEKDGLIEVNLEELGLEKLLGSGQVRNKLLVKVRRASEGAISKISNVGGKVILTEEKPG